MDDEQFGALFEVHLPAVWGFARRRCGAADVADDVAAETFAIAWRRRHDLPAPDGIRLWLLATARRVLANHRRSDGRRDRLHLRALAVAPARPQPADPADLVAERDADHLLAALATLREDDRDLLIMRAWDGLAVSDIAALLDVTPNAVSVRLSKARTRLAAALDRTDPHRSRTPQGRSPHLEGDAS